MPQSGSPHTASARVALYASVGPELTQYDVDVASASLTRRATVRLPANVHYAWPHVSGCYLYVASSDSAPGLGSAGDRAISIFIRPSLGSTFRSSARTSSTCSRFPGMRCRRHRRSARTPSPSRATSAAGRSRARCTSTRTAALCMPSIARLRQGRSREGPCLQAARIRLPSTR